MMIKMNSDESTVTETKQPTVEKVSAVKSVSAIQGQQENGNSLPGNVTASEQTADVQQANDTEAVENAVKQINENEQVIQREIEFSIDQDSGRTVIKVMDLATSEVIRQMPNEEALVFARKLSEGEDLKLINEYI